MFGFALGLVIGYIIRHIIAKIYEVDSIRTIDIEELSRNSVIEYFDRQVKKWKKGVFICVLNGHVIVRDLATGEEFYLAHYEIREPCE